MISNIRARSPIPTVSNMNLEEVRAMSEKGIRIVIDECVNELHREVLSYDPISRDGGGVAYKWVVYFLEKADSTFGEGLLERIRDTLNDRIENKMW